MATSAKLVNSALLVRINLESRVHEIHEAELFHAASGPVGALRPGASITCGLHQGALWASPVRKHHMRPPPG